METRASKKKRTRLEKLASLVTEDRITNLPEPLVHEIISRLQPQACRRLSILSKRWLYLVETLGSVNFTFEELPLNKSHTLNSYAHKMMTVLLSLRNPCFLQKVRISSDFWYVSKHQKYLGIFIDFAAHGKIGELDLFFWDYAKYPVKPSNRFYSLPIFFFQSPLLVTVLKLEDCAVRVKKFGGFPVLRALSLVNVFIKDEVLSDLVSMCARLESLTLRSCNKLFDVTLNSRTMKTLVIQYCTYVESVFMDLPLLHTFEIDKSEDGKRVHPLVVNQIIEFMTAKGVKLIHLGVLYLGYTRIDSATLCHIFDIFPKLGDLRMRGCIVDYQPQSFPGNLKKLFVVNVHGLEFIDGFASSLEVLHCDMEGSGFTDFTPGLVNFVCLKSLTIVHSFIKSTETLQLLISSCPQLEILNLHDCGYLQHIKIVSQVLKVLTVKAKLHLQIAEIEAPNLQIAEIEASNLVSFTYDGPIIEFCQLIFSPSVVCRLHFEKMHKYDDDPPFLELKDFVGKFKNASSLTLYGKCYEAIFSSDPSENPLPYGCKWGYLNLKCNEPYICYQQILNLLFISQCCATILIELCSSSSILLKFANRDESDDVTLDVGESHNCVRDHLVKVTVNHFEGDTYVLNLLKILFNKAKQLNTVHISTKPGLSVVDPLVADGVRSLKSILRNQAYQYKQRSVPNVSSTRGSNDTSTVSQKVPTGMRRYLKGIFPSMYLFSYDMEHIALNDQSQPESDCFRKLYGM